MSPPMLPAYGEPCNGCGVCCREEVCGMALEIQATLEPPCPFLLKRDGRTWCGVLERAARENAAFGQHMAWRLGIGAGCIAGRKATA